MIAGGVATPCSNCHPTATSAAAFTWATGGVISNPPAATAPFTTRPSQTGISHTGGTLWPNGGGSYTAAVAWITGGRQP